MFRPPLFFLRWFWLAPLLAASASAQNNRRGGGPPAGPLKAELHTVTSQPFSRSVPTIGTLRANESVALVPEQSRRLVEVLVTEGSAVEKGDILFKLDDSDLVTAIQETEARIRLAEANKARAASLLPNRAISQQGFDLAAAEVEILEAQKNATTVELEKTRIRAPFSGRVGVRQVSEGAYVSPATTLITLQDVSSIKVDFPVPERYAPDVKQGQKFTFTVAGMSRSFEGEVTVIEPAIDASTRSLQVRGVCAEPGGLLPGGFAEVTLMLDGMSQGLLIPSQALVPSPRGQGVYVIKDGKADLVPVDIGVRTPDQVQILRGLDEGDVIAVTNLLRLRPGLAVVSADMETPDAP